MSHIHTQHHLRHIKASSTETRSQKTYSNTQTSELKKCIWNVLSPFGRKIYCGIKGIKAGTSTLPCNQLAAQVVQEANRTQTSPGVWQRAPNIHPPLRKEWGDQSEAHGKTPMLLVWVMTPTYLRLHYCIRKTAVISRHCATGDLSRITGNFPPTFGCSVRHTVIHSMQQDGKIR